MIENSSCLGLSDPKVNPTWQGFALEFLASCLIVEFANELVIVINVISKNTLMVSGETVSRRKEDSETLSDLCQYHSQFQLTTYKLLSTPLGNLQH